MNGSGSCFYILDLLKLGSSLEMRFANRCRDDGGRRNPVPKTEEATASRSYPFRGSRARWKGAPRRLGDDQVPRRWADEPRVMASKCNLHLVRTCVYYLYEVAC